MENQKLAEQIKQEREGLKRKYAAAKDEKSLLEVFREAIVFCGNLGEGASLDDVLDLLAIGYWARYYVLKHRPIDKASIDVFLSKVEGFYEIVPRENIELRFKFGYLLAIGLNSFRGSAEAREIETEIKIMSQATGSVAMALKMINAEGLLSMGKKEWEEAIAVFLQAERCLSSEENVIDDEARQEFSNILSNRGYCRILWSESVLDQKKDLLIYDGLIELLAAINHYSKLMTQPSKHLIAIENRTIIASRIVLLTKKLTLAEIGAEIAKKFSAKDREGAKSLLLGIENTENIEALDLIKDILKKTGDLLGQEAKE